MMMDDEKLKRLLQEDMDKDVEHILAEVDSDPELRDVVAPEEIHDKLFEQIRAYEASKVEGDKTPCSVAEEAQVTPELSEEQQELIRLGKIYKKKRSRRKYWVIAVAILCAFALGITSFGGAEKVFKELERVLDGRKQTVINNDDDGENNFSEEVASEEEAFQKIEDEFGILAVKLSYLPERMKFVELVIEEDLQLAQLYYENGKGGVLNYRIFTNYRSGSIGTDIEDGLLHEYDKEINGVSLNLKEYEIDGVDINRWNITFEYKNVQYSMYTVGIEESEVQKILENLFFY